MMIVEVSRGKERRVVEIPDDEELLKQKDAAQVLKASVEYLRRSDCPKVLLPPSRGKRPLVRYRRSTLFQWALHWDTSIV